MNKPLHEMSLDERREYHNNHKCTLCKWKEICEKQMINEKSNSLPEMPLPCEKE